MNKIRTLFVGTSRFAIPILKKLVQMEEFELVGVITQPDKPVGRKQILTASELKKAIVYEGITNAKIFQPVQLKDGSESILNETNPELIIVVSYGQFIPKNMLEYPKFKCLNMHASILPDLRGAVPMPMAILKGYKETGVSLQIMEEGMDEGDLLGVKRYELDPSETTESLTDRLSDVGKELIEEVLPRWINGEIVPSEQEDSNASYCYQKDISKEVAEIDWSKPAEEIERMVRAFSPWPIAWFSLSDKNTKNQSVYGKRIKIFKISFIENDEVIQNIKVGTLFKYQKMLCIRAGNGMLRLDQIQLEGKALQSSKEYLWLI